MNTCPNLPSKVTTCQEQAEQCMRASKFTEAFFHWTHAIQSLPRSAGPQPHFHFQRSKCFLEEQQLYFALQDAEVVIRLSPETSHGYLRKAEVMFSVGDYAQALGLYQKCFQLSHKDKDSFMERIRKCQKLAARETGLDQQIPFVGAAIGIVVSILVVIADYVSQREESPLSHPFLKVVFVVLVSGLCFAMAQLYRKVTVKSKRNALEPPVDIMGGNHAFLDPFADMSSDSQSAEDKKDI